MLPPRVARAARRSLCLCSFAAAYLSDVLPAAAQATEPSGVQQGEFSVQRLEAAPGPNNVFSAERVRMSQQFGWSASLLFNYAHEPFNVVSCLSDTDCDAPNATNVEDTSVITSMAQWDLMGSFNPADFIQIGLRLPLVFVSGEGLDLTTGGPAAEGLSGFGMGDPMIEGKFRFFGDSESVVALGGAIDFSFPLGSLTSEGNYIGNDSGNSPVAVGWRGIADFQIEDFFVTANLRGIFRGENSLATTTVGPLEFRYSVGAGYAITPVFKVQAEGFGSTQFASTIGTNTMEIDGGIVISPEATGLAFTVGGGAGVIEGVGTPMFRVLGGVSFTMEDGDEDQDGINDDDDRCPTVQEDVDEFEDEDGCPEDDNDKDNNPDKTDKCPMKPETINGVDDADGCPDDVADRDGDLVPDPNDKCPDQPGKVRLPEFYGCADTDGDGVPDPADKCPTEKEDTDGFEDTDGCPDLDNDKDGIPDESDECGEEPEVKNGFKDEDGCPDEAPDSDKDGYPDHADKCPKAPETFNGFQDEDGCPDRGQSLITVGPEQITILQRVEFDTGSDKIKGQTSFAVLDAVVGAMKAHPEIFLIEVAGHTDNQGNAQMNKDLSQKRAEAVKKYMEGKGIESKRLRAMGYGQDKPIADNKLAPGRQKNRRVEFTIAESTTKKAAPAPTP